MRLSTGWIPLGGGLTCSTILLFLPFYSQLKPMRHRTPSRTSTLAALVIIAGFGTSAHPDTEISQEMEVCMAKVDLSAMKNLQWVGCYTEELKRQDAKLNESFRYVQLNIPADAKGALSKAQRSWIAFRDSWCGYEAALPDAPGEEVNRLACLVELTVAQEKRIRGSVP